GRRCRGRWAHPASPVGGAGPSGRPVGARGRVPEGPELPGGLIADRDGLAQCPPEGPVYCAAPASGCRETPRPTAEHDRKGSVMDQEAWMVVAGVALVMLVLGFLLGRIFGGAKSRVVELEMELARQQTELSDYKQEVEAHF